jgi:hypothetical protein
MWQLAALERRRSAADILTMGQNGALIAVASIIALIAICSLFALWRK